MNAPENHGERVQSAWATSALAPASSERVRAGDEAGQHRVDHRAADHHGGVEEAVAHGGVADGERIEQHEHRPHLRIHRAVVVVDERREHEGQPAPEPEADAEHEDRGLLVHERRVGAAARVDERPDLDGEGHGGDGELKRQRTPDRASRRREARAPPRTRPRRPATTGCRPPAPRGRAAGSRGAARAMPGAPGSPDTSGRRPTRGRTGAAARSSPGWPRTSSARAPPRARPRWTRPRGTCR